MLPWKRLLWVYAFVTSFCIDLTVSLPLRSTPTGRNPIGHLRTPRAQVNFPLITQAASWPLIHAPKSTPGDRDGRSMHYELPVVSEVFKKMVTDRNSPPEALPAPLATTDSPTTTRVINPTGPLQMIGPGIVVLPTPVPTSTPTTHATEPSSTSDSASPEIHPYPVPARKLIIIGSVMGAILASTLLSYILLNHRCLGLCRKKKSERQSWVTFRSTPDEREPKEKGKGIDSPTPPWLRLSSSLSSNGSTFVPKTPEAKNAPYTQSRIIDISPDFPRSKFSVTSSDYPCSPSSSNPSFVSAPSTMTRDPAIPPPLMAPAEFFCLPSAPDLQNPRHSRIRSEPVFGHVLPTPSQSLATIRSGEHRRSKSVSGLVYIVPPSVCIYPDRKDSGSEWSGSPPSAAGDYLRAS
ncbi:hypothetical protein BDZ94DRAFT_1247819 [Collybia nuda]|uniref:Uncharacterized protein n=1 Tax=Collybia nuda TaxID=64659 RepID=A0A9P5YFP6_9AGAR|nr:hypothetical protein BDZ94DRAFT_1247819 [Collybia nuda]